MHLPAMRLSWEPATNVCGIFESALFSKCIGGSTGNRRLCSLTACQTERLSILTNSEHIFHSLVNGFKPLSLFRDSRIGKMQYKILIRQIVYNSFKDIFYIFQNEVINLKLAKMTKCCKLHMASKNKQYWTISIFMDHNSLVMIIMLTDLYLLQRWRRQQNEAFLGSSELQSQPGKVFINHYTIDSKSNGCLVGKKISLGLFFNTSNHHIIIS